MGFFRNSLPLIVIFVLFISGATDVYAADFKLPWPETVVYSNSFVERTQQNLYFNNGDFFWIARFSFLADSDKPCVSSFTIPGEEIELRYTAEKDGIKRWVLTDDVKNTAKSTLFISTDKYHLILGVPAVYEKQDDYGTLSIARSKETPAVITKGNGFFTISLSFPQKKDYIGEVWCLQSENRLIDWDERAEEQFMSHELANGRRLSQGGYYFQTFNDYSPGGPDVLFRHPSSYTGGSFSRFSGSNAETDLGYAIMRLSAANQNEMGYYAIPCESRWLLKDFGIGTGYYDTRWNSDFASNLIDAYLSYGDQEFLDRAVKYADFFINYAENNSYSTGAGILVQDYWHEDGNKPTHVSLNHHLAELNALLRLYDVTKDERYRGIAERMLLGIEETEADWSLPNGNLVYALHYNGTENNMVDYPYLTYNDLFVTRGLLKNVLGKTSASIQRLMDGKLDWMVKNGVDGYWR